MYSMDIYMNFFTYNKSWAVTETRLIGLARWPRAHGVNILIGEYIIEQTDWQKYYIGNHSLRNG